MRSESHLSISDNLLGECGSVGALVGSSAWTGEMRHKVLGLARHASTVLITGPNGTGKEIIARAIHDHSQRRAKPFIPVDCASLISLLFPSHMFGHVKGAFTGAEHETLGCIRAAHGGTLFLDEIGELEPAQQAMLLRVLQERVVVPVGGVQGIPVDVRLICATNRDLRREVAAGRFRQDLFYRLNVVQLRTLPLAERPADILALAEHFLSLMVREAGVPLKRLSEEAFSLLAAYSWPGNVRQLRNVLEQAVVYCEQETISAPLLARILFEEQTPAEPPLTENTRQEQLFRQLPPTPAEVIRQAELQQELSAEQSAWLSLEELERHHIRQTLEYTFFNQSAAARLLQTTPRILAGKIKKYGIDSSQSRRGRPARK